MAKIVKEVEQGKQEILLYGVEVSNPDRELFKRVQGKLFRADFGSEPSEEYFYDIVPREGVEVYQVARYEHGFDGPWETYLVAVKEGKVAGWFLNRYKIGKHENEESTEKVSFNDLPDWVQKSATKYCAGRWIIA